LLAVAGGLVQPSQGRVLLDGVDVTGWDDDARTVLRRERVGFVFQAFHLMPYLTAAENVELPMRLTGQRPARRRVDALLAHVGMTERAGHLPDALSGGQQQRVAIARALVTDPAVVLADEPTGALDSGSAAEVLALLRSCVDELGRTVVMVTHDPVAAAHADAVVFLVDGRVVGQMVHPTAEAVAARMARLDELVAPGMVSA
jgi:putative ABC transport system ATP-binding protein